MPSRPMSAKAGPVFIETCTGMPALSTLRTSSMEIGNGWPCKRWVPASDFN